jgi:hypothetical protein
MTPEELQASINTTKQQIEQLKLQIEESADSKERHRLILKLKELQILQLWHIDQLEATP